MVSNLSLLPFAEPGISRFKLARLDRFQFPWTLDLDVEGTIIDCERCSTDDLVHALLDTLGSAPLEMLSLNEGRSSFDARSTKSGLNSPCDLEGREMFSKETCSTSGDDIMEAEVVRPSVEEA